MDVRFGYKESWAPKNWCFWTVVFKKTLESPLDGMEIQSVHSKKKSVLKYSLEGLMLKLKFQYIVRNAGLEDTQDGIKIAGRNINNLRYADDTTLMAESEENLKSLLMKV